MMNIRVFIIGAMQTNIKFNAYMVLGLGLLSVLLVRSFMPSLAE
jgi:accessory gene regulator protein AgrB